MTTAELRDYRVVLTISAACEADARELIDDYTGAETSVEIEEVKELPVGWDSIVGPADYRPEVKKQ